MSLHTKIKIYSQHSISHMCKAYKILLGRYFLKKMTILKFVVRVDRKMNTIISVPIPALPLMSFLTLNRPLSLLCLDFLICKMDTLHPHIRVVAVRIKCGNSLRNTAL